MLQIEEVVKRYGDQTVVNRVSATIEDGEIFALLGPNGAGKTTLIRMITDIIKPDSGSIRLDGIAVGGEGRRGLSYLPEERGLYRRVRLVEALAYYGELKGMTPSSARAGAMALIERVGLPEYALKQIQTLSKGMQQKVQLCTALIGEPRLLILDEPFTGLDPLNVQLFEEMIAERRKAGTTVLLSTHQMNKVEELCDRALMINHGHMVLYGAVRDLRKRYADNAVVVSGGPIPEGVPGVRSRENVNGEVKLTLESGTTPSAVLRALLDRNVAVESFSLAAPPLEDIFIKVVREGIGLDQGRSGAPAVDEPAGAGVGR
jgi:ABC-2 type transport system ATP-binding protein